MNFLSALLSRPILEIAELVGIALVVFLAVGFFILRLIKALHIKKIGVTGIECGETPPQSVTKKKRRKPCAR